MIHLDHFSVWIWSFFDPFGSRKSLLTAACATPTIRAISEIARQANTYRRQPSRQAINYIIKARQIKRENGNSSSQGIQKAQHPRNNKHRP